LNTETIFPFDENFVRRLLFELLKDKISELRAAYRK